MSLLTFSILASLLLTSQAFEIVIAVKPVSPAKLLGLAALVRLVRPVKLAMLVEPARLVKPVKLARLAGLVGPVGPVKLARPVILVVAVAATAESPTYILPFSCWGRLY